MTLHNPFIISARLLPALKVGDGTISIEFAKRQGRDGRVRYRWYIDTPKFEETGDDLQSGCQGGSSQQGIASLLSFLVACAESIRYGRQYAADGSITKDGENANLFPANVGEWATNHSDEISMLQMELEETPNLIED